MLDASVLVAALSPAEVHHADARTLFALLPEQHAYLVPSIFRLEVLAAMARRGESDEVLDTVDALVSGPRFHAHPIGVDITERAVVVARRARLRAYDAIYAALALIRPAALVTLDTDVVERLALSFPELRVMSTRNAEPHRPRPPDRAARQRSRKA